MEYWINSIESFQTNVSSVLIMQLKRAMSSLDIFLETDSMRLASSSSVEVKAEKTFLKVFRGRVRSRPYKIIQNGGSVIYTQIWCRCDDFSLVLFDQFFYYAHFHDQDVILNDNKLK